MLQEAIVISIHAYLYPRSLRRTQKFG